MSKNKKDLVMIISPFASPNIGGVETHLDKLLTAATKANYKVALITYQPLTTDINWEKHTKEKDYEIFRVTWFGMGLFPKLEGFFPVVFLYLFPGLFIKSLQYYFQNHTRVRTIHAHGLAAGTIARILKIIHKTNIVLSTHAIYSFDARPVLSFFVRKILQGFDYILGVSDVSKNELIKMGLSKNLVGVHRNWIDTARFSLREKEKVRKKLHLGKTLNVLFVGRFIELKGVERLCAAAKLTPEVTFHFVGQGPLENTVINLEKKLRNLIYHGVLMQNSEIELEKLIDLYCACDYVISPYLYDEGFSITLIESLCCGTPLIVSNRGSPPTFLTTEVATFLSADPTPKEISNTLKKLANEKPAYEKTQKVCRAFAVKNFSEKNAELILRHY
jgi:glycosyltransferase involved in cell wall biosynthesis